MEIVNPHAGGIDCGAQEYYVAVPPQSVEPAKRKVKRKPQANEPKDRFSRLFTAHLRSGPDSGHRAQCLECVAHCLGDRR